MKNQKAKCKKIWLRIGSISEKKCNPTVMPTKSDSDVILCLHLLS